MCQLKFIPRDIKRAVKDAEYVDVSIVLYEIGDSVMSVQQDADVSR